MQMIWIRMPAQRQKCKEPWIKSHSHVITMISQSAQKDRDFTPTSTYNEPDITVNGQKLKVIDKFTYLGSTLFRAVHIDDEVTARTAKASVAFGSLRKLDTKLKVYQAVLLPTLLYACETWTVYQRHAKVQVGKDQEKAQSEKDSHSKNRGGKKKQTNNQVLIP